MKIRTSRFSVLMCAPEHYSIRYEINPWMKLRHPIDRPKAARQWQGLYNALRKLKIKVLKIPQAQNCPDMVFTANAGVVSGRTFIPSHFRFPQRRNEEPAFTHYFQKKKYKIRDASKGLFFEGEGDLLPYRDMLFGGYRFRSQAAAHERAGQAMAKHVVTLELATPHFYHLDTCFFPLDDATVLYYPRAFNPQGRKMIKTFIRNPIAVSKEDAFQFACNGIRVGRTVVLNKASRALKHQLKELGYRVVETPTSEFMKAGGSVKCLLLKLS